MWSLPKAGSLGDPGSGLGFPVHLTGRLQDPAREGWISSLDMKVQENAL